MTQTIDKYEHAELDSTALAEAFFAPAADYNGVGSLFVRFHDGRLAGYRDVSRHVFQDLVSSPSAGRYWRNNIQHVYRGQSGDVEFVSLSEPAETGDPFKEWLKGEVTIMTEQTNPEPLNEYKVTYTAVEQTETVRAVSFDEAVSAITNGDENIKVTKVELV